MRRLAAAVTLALASTGAASALPDAPPPSDLEREIAEPRVRATAIRVEGATAVPMEALRAEIAPYEGRALSGRELRELQRKLTAVYASRGFVTSRVELPDQSVAGGPIVFRAVEVPVTQVRFSSPPRVASPAWLTRLIVPDPAAPASLPQLQERMAWLRDDGIVERITLELAPLPAPGGSELVVEVEEPRPWSAVLRYDNHHAPAVGARRPTLELAHRNLTGWGDALQLRYGDTSGLEDVLASWSAPVPGTGLRAGVRFERSDSLAIDPPAFRELDIRSVAETRAGWVARDWVRTASRTVTTEIARERRESRTSLLGLPFSFTPGIPDDGARLSAWRLAAAASLRDDSKVAFARLQASRGTVTVDELPEGLAGPASRFTAFHATAQLALRLPWRGAMAIARAQAQYTRNTLLAMEKLPLGGAQTVRGYRENLLLRDRGAAGSIELQVPAWEREGVARVALAAFADAAWSRDTLRRDDGLPATIASAGVGVIAALPRGFSARIYAAQPTKRHLTDRRDLQDRGVHFEIAWDAGALLD